MHERSFSNPSPDVYICAMEFLLTYFIDHSRGIITRSMINSVPGRYGMERNSQHIDLKDFT